MAKLNHVELSPSKDSPATAEDEIEAGSDDERAADVLNKSLRSSTTKAPREQQPNRIFEVLKYFKPGKQPSAQNVGHFFYPLENSTNEEGQDVANPDESEEVQIAKQLADNGSIRIVGLQRISGSMNTAKGEVGAVNRKMDTPSRRNNSTNVGKRKDIYNVDSDSENLEQGGEAEQSAHRPAKRIKSSKKAKTPIEWHSAEQTVTTKRETRSHARAMAKETPTKSEKSPTNRRGATKAADHPSEPSTKPRRGRPAKSKLVKSEVIAEKPIDEQEVADESEEHHHQSEEDGTSGLFMEPSPVKPIISTPQSLKSKQQLSGTPPNYGTSSAPTGREIFVSDDFDEDSEEETDVDEQSIVLPTKLKDILPVQTFKRMLETVQRVGQKQNKKTKEWMDVLEAKPRLQSIPAERMLRCLKFLIEIYTNIAKVRVAGDEDAKLNQDAADEEVGKLLKESEVIFNERLGSEGDGFPQQSTERTQHMLSDIYFFLVPSIVKVLILAAKAYQDEEIAETTTTKQVINILDLLRRLGERTVNQPKDVQLKNELYRTSAPTRSVIPKTRALLKIWRTEVRRGELVRKAEAWNAGAAERERRRVAKEEQEINRWERERGQRHRQQAKEFRAKLEDPGLYGHLLRKELGISQLDERQRARLYRSSAPNYHDDDGDTNDEDDPFDEREESTARMTPLLINPTGSSRPSLGKKSNKHHGPRPLGLREKQIVTNTLRLEDRSYRYQLAAERVGRDMEEIIAFAKVFQESMDRQHEIGKWNREEDAWTYDIWVEKV